MMMGIWFGSSLTRPRDETNQTFPEDNLSLLTAKTDQCGWQSALSEVELEYQRANVVYQQLVSADQSRVLRFCYIHGPKVQHHWRGNNLQHQEYWTWTTYPMGLTGEEKIKTKTRILIPPHDLVWVLVSLYISAAIEKFTQKDLLHNVLIFN